MSSPVKTPAAPPLCVLQVPAVEDFGVDTPAPPIATADSMPTVDESAGEPSRWRIGDFLSFETSTIVHAALILILALITSKQAAERTVNLLATPYSAEPMLLENEPALIAMAESETSTEILAPAPPQVAFDPSHDSNDEPPGPESVDIGGLDAPSDVGLPVGASLLLGGGREGRGGSLHGRGDLAVFANRLTKAKAKTGDIQISLIWHNLNDLDLHVRAPSGEVICYFQRLSRCRGMLDVDMNAGNRMTKEPVENVFWPRGRAPFGEFVVTVDHFNNNGGADPTEFEVLVQIDGEMRTFRQSISFGQSPVEIYRFERRKDGTRPRVDSPNDDFPL